MVFTRTSPGQRPPTGPFVAALAAMTLLPIGIHTLLLDGLGVPYPSALPRTGWIAVPDHVLLIPGLIRLQAVLRRRPRRSALRRGLFLFLAVGAINQALFRLPIMRNVVSTRWTIYPFVDNLPAMLWFALAVTGVLFLASWATTLPRRLAAAAALAALLDRVVAPLIGAAFAPVVAADGRREGDQLYTVPYDWHVDVPSYLTYAEPALAALATAIVLRRLRVAPGGIVALLFALQGGPLFCVFANVYYAPQGPAVAMLSEGQFALEALALAGLAAACSVLLVDRAGTSGRSRPWRPG